MDTMGRAISERRKYLKITQSDLSEMSGVSLRTIKAIEKGGANPTLGTMKTILELLGLQMKLTNKVLNE